MNPATGALVITGRAKDTIVLSNGENVEPGKTVTVIDSCYMRVGPGMIVTVPCKYF